MKDAKFCAAKHVIFDVLVGSAYLKNCERIHSGIPVGAKTYFAATIEGLGLVLDVMVLAQQLKNKDNDQYI